MIDRNKPPAFRWQGDRDSAVLDVGDRQPVVIRREMPAGTVAPYPTTGLQWYIFDGSTLKDTIPRLDGESDADLWARIADSIDPTIAGRDVVIWRYMDLAKYIGLLDEGLFFARRSALAKVDPWEGSWGWAKAAEVRDRIKAGESGKGIKEDWERRLKAKREAVERHGISCWYRSTNESAALWELYVARGMGVAVKSTVGRVLESLVDRERIPRVESVDYSEDYSKGPTSDDPVILLRHKRVEFSHENELRFILPLSQDELGYADFLRSGVARFKRPISLDPTHSDHIWRGESWSSSAEINTERIRPDGIVLQCDYARLIEKVHLAPGVSLPIRSAVRAVTQRFGLPVAVVAESKFDIPLPDDIAFIEATESGEQPGS